MRIGEGRRLSGESWEAIPPAQPAYLQFRRQAAPPSRRKAKRALTAVTPAPYCSARVGLGKIFLWTGRLPE